MGDILLRELINPIFNEIRHGIHVFIINYKEYTNILEKQFEEKTLQCNNCNERAIIRQLLHACTVHLKFVGKKPYKYSNTNIYFLFTKDKSLESLPNKD